MSVADDIVKLLGKLPAGTLPLLVGFLRDLVKTRDPKAVLTRSREIAAKSIGFREAQKARRPKE